MDWDVIRTVYLALTGVFNNFINLLYNIFNPQKGE